MCLEACLEAAAAPGEAAGDESSSRADQGAVQRLRPGATGSRQYPGGAAGTPNQDQAAAAPGTEMGTIKDHRNEA